MAQHGQPGQQAVRWLLDSEIPGVRYLALRDLVDAPPDDPALIAARQAAYATGPIATILAAMDPAGYWVKPGAGYTGKYRSTVWAILMLAQVGASAAQDERIARACAYLLDYTLAAGQQFSTSGAPSHTIDCLQGNLCAALVDLGCDDPRLDAAYEWMARSVTGEGVAPAADQQAPLHYYAIKCGPGFACHYNDRFPCAWGAVKVLLAFSKWPAARRTPLIERAIQQGVEFLFSVDPITAAYPTPRGNKPSKAWWKFGFPVFFITDLLQLVEALAGLGYGRDPRLATTLAIIRDKQDAQGRWALDYDYTDRTWVEWGLPHAPNPWVTYRALRVLQAVADY